MKRVLILAAVLLLVILNCSKKTTTNNYYYDGPEEAGAMVGVVHPPESRAEVTAYMGIPIASTQIDSVGYFKLSGLPAGDYKLLVEAVGYRDYASKPSIKVTDGATTLVDAIFLASIHDLIRWVSPYDGAQGVKLSESIRIYFHTPMNQTGFETAFHIEPTVEGTFYWYPSKPSNSVEFNPKYQLATNTRYQVIIDTTASDTAEVKLLQPYQFAFTTEPLRVEDTYPRHNQTQVSPSTRINISFNAEMDAGSVQSAFRMIDSGLEDVMGAFYWSSNQRRMEFRPNSPLAAGEMYTVTIDTTASDVSGGKLPEPHQFSFTTESIKIEHTTPRDNDTQVHPFTKIRISFNTEMDIESVNSAFSIVDSELYHVTGEIRWSALQAMEFRPDLPLAVNETYTVTIDTTASGISGAKLREAHHFSFTTDCLRVSSSPKDNATEVSPHTAIRLTFNTYMETKSVAGAFQMVDSELEDVIGDILWPSEYAMEFRPSSALALSQEYTVTVDTTATDMKGTKLPESYQFSFTTEPIRISSSPGDNQTWVSPLAIVRLMFNTDMDIGSVSSAFKMVDSELNEVTGNHSWAGFSRMEFAPHVTLATNEKYTATIDTSARTTQGTKLLEPYQFSFTTQPLLILSTSPKNKETWVSPFATIRIAFNTDMDTETVISAFQMVDSELNDVVGHFVSPDPTTLQFNPDPPLAPGETYTITIAASAADMYGKTLITPYSFWFKTRSD